MLSTKQTLSPTNFTVSATDPIIVNFASTSGYALSSPTIQYVDNASYAVNSGYASTSGYSLNVATASNGLTKTNLNIALGGALTSDTVISGTSGLSLNTSILKFGSVVTATDELIVDFPIMSSDGTISKRRQSWTDGTNRSTSLQSIKGVGTINVTNGSTSITGNSTLFTDATYTGLSFWLQLWVFDSTTWWRGSSVSVTNATTATVATWYSKTQADAGYINSSTSGYGGITGTYEFYIVKNFSDNYSTAMGNNATANNYSFAMGGNVTASGQNSFAVGNTLAATGVRSVAWGGSVLSSGTASFAGGAGVFTVNSIDRRITASGNRSFIWSENNASQTAGHGALAANSAILGGLNHNIVSGSNDSFIIGGQLNKIAAASVDAGIVGGASNTFSSGASTRSVIIGGNTINVASATTDTVFMPKVRVGLGTGGALTTVANNNNMLVRNVSTGELETQSISQTMSNGTSGYATQAHAPFKLQRFTILPSASINTYGIIVYNSAGTAGDSLAFSNGSVWKNALGVTVV